MDEFALFRMCFPEDWVKNTLHPATNKEIKGDHLTLSEFYVYHSRTREAEGVLLTQAVRQIEAGAMKKLRKAGEHPFVMGKITKGSGQVLWK